VNIAKHLEKYPQDKVETVMENVFSFDTYDSQVKENILKVLQKYEFKIDGQFLHPSHVSGMEGKEPLRLEYHSPSTREAKGPKHGKIDPNNTPHVGGNTWAGGTGGSDTAGLGGKGGPYRLDAGHPVHQISDKEKQ